MSIAPITPTTIRETPDAGGDELRELLPDEQKALYDLERKQFGLMLQFADLEAEAERFEAPLRKMFENLTDALDTLPTADQKAKAGAKAGRLQP